MQHIQICISLLGLSLSHFFPSPSLPTQRDHDSVCSVILLHPSHNLILRCRASSPTRPRINPIHLPIHSPSQRSGSGSDLQARQADRHTAKILTCLPTLLPAHHHLSASPILFVIAINRPGFRRPCWFQNAGSQTTIFSIDDDDNNKDSTPRIESSLNPRLSFQLVFFFILIFFLFSWFGTVRPPPLPMTPAQPPGIIL